MRAILQRSTLKNHSDIRISGSKSESNRSLLLQYLYPNLQLQNLSDSDDSRAMQAALASSAYEIDIHHAGTAMRFLTALFAVQPNRTVYLTGSSRMQERPIAPLVDALRQLGAQIEYAKKEGFPPLLIKGQALKASTVTLAADTSSQYISALLLIAPQLEEGLTLNLRGTITSKPYIEMTLALLDSLGIQSSFTGQQICVAAQKQISDAVFTVESDWSSASYFYSMVALSSPGTQVRLSSFKRQSLQGDAALRDLYGSFGVHTRFEQQAIVLTKSGTHSGHFSANLIQTPDLAQTLAVTCFGLGVSCDLTGLHTLKIKETDRLEALKIELSRLGADLTVTSDSLHLQSSSTILAHGAIDTYQDHRMALAFAPLALKTHLTINQAEVVSKSYLNFWKDLQKTGIALHLED